MDVLGVRLNGPKAEGKHIVLNWRFTDTGESFTLTLENCALTYVAGALAATADAGFTLARGVLDEVIARQTSFPEAMAAGKIEFTGNPMRLGELMALMDEFPRTVRDRRAEADGGELRDAVIPGRCKASNPESRDSGSGPSDHPGMTEDGSRPSTASRRQLIFLGLRLMFRLAVRAGLGVADGLGQHLAQFSLGLRGSLGDRCLPLCHGLYVGMPGGDLNPTRDGKRARRVLKAAI